MGKELPAPDTVVADTPGCPFIDMWSDEYNERNLELLKDLRENYDLAFHRQGNTTVPLVTRYKDLWKIHRDWRTFRPRIWRTAGTTTPMTPRCSFPSTPTRRFTASGVRSSSR